MKTTWTMTRGADRIEATIETAPRLVVKRNWTDIGAGYGFTSSMSRHPARFPRLFAWRLGRRLKALGYTRTA